MSTHEHPLDKLFEHIKKNGTKGLLPQNLPEDLLYRMISEADAIENETTEETPSSVLLMTILHLEGGPKVAKKMDIKIAQEKLVEYFDLYIISIGLEEMRRKKVIIVPDESLPTLKNIFDKKRSIDFSEAEWLDG